MKDYNKLFLGFEENKRVLREIDSFLKGYDVVDSEEVISAYSLCKELDKYLKKCRNKAYNNMGLVRKLNSTYKRQDKEESRLLGWDSTNLEIKDISVNLYENSGAASKIALSVAPFGRNCAPDGFKHNYLYRNGDGQLRFQYPFPTINAKVIQDNYNEIMDMIYLREEYYEMFAWGEDYEYAGKDHMQVFSDPLFKVYITFNVYGDVRYRIVLNNYPEEMSKRNLQDSESVNDLISRNSENILRKIPVEVKSLDPISEYIVREHRREKAKIRKKLF